MDSHKLQAFETNHAADGSFGPMHHPHTEASKDEISFDGQLEHGEAAQTLGSCAQAASMTYLKRNWNGFELKSIPFQMQYLDRFAKPIFDHYDKAGSGSLPIEDAGNLIGHFFFYLRVSPPSEVEVEYLKYLHDRTHEGTLDFARFASMLKSIQSGK